MVSQQDDNDGNDGYDCNNGDDCDDCDDGDYSDDADNSDDYVEKKFFKPFWNENYNELSKSLWFPKYKENNETTQNFWMKKQLNLNNTDWLMNKYPLKPEILKKKKTKKSDKSKECKKCTKEKECKKCTKKKNFKNGEHIVKTISIPVYLTDPSQRKILMQWFGTSRYVYNKTLLRSNDALRQVI